MRKTAWQARLEQAAWFLFAVSLPLTSFPLVQRLTGSSMVAPAALLVLPLVLAFSTLPSLLRGGKLPLQSLPLLAFISVAIVAAATAFFLPIPPHRQIPLWKTELEALVTLALGAAFFFVVAVWANREERLSFFFRWVNWSGAAVLVWGVLQKIFHVYPAIYPDWMVSIQSLLVTHEMYPARITGFAYEPSWLAHQLNMLYLPWWLAASVTGVTAHRLRLGPLTLERILLVGGAMALWLSVSRIGLLGFLLMLALLLLLGVLWLIGWLERRLLARTHWTGRTLTLVRWGVRAGLALGLIVLALGMFLAAGLALSRFDPRMANLFDLKTLREYDFVYYANQLVFAERIIFWQAGWNVFNRFPLLGVGPGNAGFFFSQTLSAFSWHLTEVRTLLYHLDVVPNIKSLWVRVLAETGLAGFACFSVFLYEIWRSGSALRKMKGIAGAAGLTSMLAITALITEGFSVDTFGLPYYWVVFGLAAGATLITASKGKSS
ncbi:MAG: O-antigen ligase family protein [Anaerolineae bacterium]|nr:O-antigen ligase family protein [Anaerolineae bacterium]